jgi:S1-C subfamily serine protease
MRFRFYQLAFIAITICLLAPTSHAQQDLQTTPLIDDAGIKARIFRRGMRNLQGDHVSGETLLEQLSDCPESKDLNVVSQTAANNNNAFEGCRKSTMVIGNLYDCGKCNRTHLGTAGAVVLSTEGLLLTNYHVVDNEQTMHLIAMDESGETYPVVEIVAANELADLAVIRVKADNLTPVELAPANPKPMEELFVISHPHDRFFLTTTGVVSRYAYGKKKRSDKRDSWMEITAVFSQGSSGCGVFDEQGRLIGLVSRKDTIYAKGSNGKDQPALTVRKCVPISAVHEMIRGSDENESEDSSEEN